jgi:hypothetical protein
MIAGAFRQRSVVQRRESADVDRRLRVENARFIGVLFRGVGRCSSPATCNRRYDL